MKKKILAICLIVSLAAIVFAFTACTDDEKTPEINEGTIYQSDIVRFWFGVGKAYMTLENLPKPAEPVEGELYGYVFKVYVDAGDGYSSWLSGTWDIDGDTLSLTAEWDATAENPTTLEGTESGVAKTYTAENGEFTVKVNLPSAGAQKFVLKKAGAAE